MKIVQRHVRFGDPHITTDDADRLSILGNVFEALVSHGDHGTFAPQLAASWSLSSDARRWTFRLRDDVWFHDGKRLTADDVVRSLLRVRDESIRGELGTTGVIASYLRGSRITSLGPLDLAVETVEPMADLLDLLVDLPILSNHAIEAIVAGEFCGTGPYQIVDYTDSVVHMRRRSDRDKRFDHLRLPEKLVWQAASDDNERATMLLEGEVDVAAGLAPESVDRIKPSEDCAIARSQTTVCAAFMFNLGAGHSRALRRAVNFGINQAALINLTLNGEAVPITGPMTSLHLGFDPDFVGFPFDPDRARTEIERDQDGVPSTLKLDVPTVLPDEARALAAGISEQLAALNIAVETVVHHDRTAYADMVQASEIHDAACFDSSPASTYRLLREKFHSGIAGPWWLGYTNEGVDELIDRGARTVNVAARRTIYQEAFRQISEDAPWIFLHNPTRLTGVRGKALKRGWRPARAGLALIAT